MPTRNVLVLLLRLTLLVVRVLMAIAWWRWNLCNRVTACFFFTFNICWQWSWSWFCSGAQVLTQGKTEKKRCKLVLEMRAGIFNVEGEEGRGKVDSQCYFQFPRWNWVSMINLSALMVVGWSWTCFLTLNKRVMKVWLSKWQEGALKRSKADLKEVRKNWECEDEEMKRRKRRRVWRSRLERVLWRIGRKYFTTGTGKYYTTNSIQY